MAFSAVKITFSTPLPLTHTQKNRRVRTHRSRASGSRPPYAAEQRVPGIIICCRLIHIVINMYTQ